MTIAVVLTLVVLLGLSVVVAVARDRGATPTDVAIGYGRALASRDFDALYRMTDGEVLRGRNRPEWIAERAAQPSAAMLPSAIAAQSTVETGEHARVVLAVGAAGATAVVDLVLRERIWVVAAFTLSSESITAPRDQAQ